jgi:hypothetical protein
VLAADAMLADNVCKKFYSNMPRELFDKKIAAAKLITEPKVIAQLKEINTNLDSRRPLSEWSNDELLASSRRRGFWSFSRCLGCSARSSCLS